MRVARIGPVDAILGLGLEVDEVTDELATADRNQLTGALVSAPLAGSFEILEAADPAALQLAL